MPSKLGQCVHVPTIFSYLPSDMEEGAEEFDRAVAAHLSYCLPTLDPCVYVLRHGSEEVIRYEKDDIARDLHPEKFVSVRWILEQQLPNYNPTAERIFCLQLPSGEVKSEVFRAPRGMRPLTR